MNIQNLPRHDSDNPDAPIIHRIFRPKLDALMFFDWQSMEYTVFAYYLSKAVGDDTLADRLRSGTDPHAATAADVFGDVEEFKRIPVRQVAKKLNFSVIYGGGAPTISDQLGLSEDDARKLLKRLHKTQPGIRKLSDALEASYRRKGFIRTLYGRELRAEKLHVLINYLIQGSCAEIMKRSLVKVHRYLSGDDPSFAAHLVASIHDELVVDALRSEVPVLAEAIPPLMADKKIGRILPLEVDCEVTYTNWAEKKPYEKEAA